MITTKTGAQDLTRQSFNGGSIPVYPMTMSVLQAPTRPGFVLGDVSTYPRLADFGPIFRGGDFHFYVGVTSYGYTGIEFEGMPPPPDIPVVQPDTFTGYVRMASIQASTSQALTLVGSTVTDEVGASTPGPNYEYTGDSTFYLFRYAGTLDLIPLNTNVNRLAPFSSGNYALVATIASSTGYIGSQTKSPVFCDPWVSNPIPPPYTTVTTDNRAVKGGYLEIP